MTIQSLNGYQSRADAVISAVLQFLRVPKGIVSMKRVALSITTGLLVALARALLVNGPSDLYWPHCAARALLGGSDAYSAVCITYHNGVPWIVNPLTTAMVFLPLTKLTLEHATIVVLFLSSALMAYGLLANGDPVRLLLFFSVPFIHAWYYAQWSPLMLAVALLPALLPLALIKPHTGLPALLCNLTRGRVLGLALFGLASLLILPAWPWEWLAQANTYDGFIPMLTVPGVLLLALLRRWRDGDARYLLLCALAPQRNVYYDMLIVAAVLRSRFELLIWFTSGWIMFGAKIYFGYDLPDWVAVCCLYLPAAVLILVRRPNSPLVSAPAEGSRSPVCPPRSPSQPPPSARS